MNNEDSHTFGSAAPRAKALWKMLGTGPDCEDLEVAEFGGSQ